MPEKTIQELINNVKEIKEEEIASLREEMSFLRSKFYNYTEVKKMEAFETTQKIDSLEQDSKMKNLRIVGIPEEPSEDLQQKIFMLATQKLDLQSIEEEDIDQCYRLGKVNNLKARDVIVKFKSKERRDLVYRCRRNMPREDPPIYINEELTQSRSKLFCRFMKENEWKTVG